MAKTTGSSASERLELEKFLPYRLNVLAEVVSQSLSRLYESRFGIAIPEWRIVATLGQYRRMTAKEIGAHSHMHKTKVSRAVAALEAKGLLARTPNDEDMREAFLQLTPRGEDVYKALAPDALAFSDALLDALDADEKAALEIILTRLTDRSIALAENFIKSD
ncbi:MarR family transcriptional regulator [Stappia sp. F7233]|uniref:MarR family transcriptional regulator n=1 Tax=Stappia albiluteola TaxID=2758565 RepID=A0A839AKG6_9HYPH|nr:MarR family transcriptional regulator [Stappia albiluteola]MBA5779372.1 MarR family transcriptional regulator [Stappia albiluteola]